MQRPPGDHHCNLVYLFPWTCGAGHVVRYWVYGSLGGIQGQCYTLQKEAGMEVTAAPLPPQPKQPAPSNAAALNAKAEAAAAQPLPDSDESDDDALGDVKGIMRTGVPKENGTIASKQSKVIWLTMSVMPLRA